MIMMTKALTIKRSEYTFGRPRFFGGSGNGIRSTNLTNMTSNGSRYTIQLPLTTFVSQLKWYKGDCAGAIPGTDFYDFIYDHPSGR
jgi:hypothetical protein